MDINYNQDVVYTKPWGNHKDGYYRLVYNSGSYAILQKIKDGIVLGEKSITIRTKGGYYDIEDFARENGFTEI